MKTLFFLFLVTVFCLFLSSSSCAQGAVHEETTGKADTVVVTLLVMNETLSAGLVHHADVFSSLHPETKVVIKTTTRNQLKDEILADLQSDTPQYDGYVGSPQWVIEFLRCESCPGEIIDDGTGPVKYVLEPLTEELRKENREYQRWDILPFWQRSTSFYGFQTFWIPLDGDVHFFYYRDDVLKLHDLSIPPTWEDLLSTSLHLSSLPDAQQDWNGDGEKDYVFCITNAANDVTWWWPWTVVAPMVQKGGTSEGMFFDSETFVPTVSGAAFRRALEITKDLMTRVGIPQGSTLLDARNYMQNGRCVFSLDWGDIVQVANNSLYRDTIKLSKTPGSTYIQNKDGQLENCTYTSCPWATISEDGRVINFSPYAANFGWSGYISARSPAANKHGVFSYFSYLGSPEISLSDVTVGTTGFQAYRFSHLDESAWVKAGYSANSIADTLSGMKEAISHPNIVLDLQIPGTNSYMVAIDSLLQDFLYGNLSVDAITANLTATWNQISHELGKETQTNLYRGSLGQDPIVFRHYVSLEPGGRIALIVISAISLFIMCVFLLLTFIYRKHKIIKWSSVRFLLLMEFGGCMVFIGIIVWMATPSAATCTTALVLILLGLALLISNLFARTLRLWIIFRAAKKARRRKITDLELLPAVIVIIGLVSILIAVWCGLDNPVPQYATSGLPDDEYTYVCNSPDYHWEFFITACALFGSFLLLGSILTWSTRNIVRSLNESRFLAVSIYNLAVALAILIVVVITITSVNVLFLVAAAIILVAALSSIGIVMIPKFYGIFTNADTALYFGSPKHSSASPSSAERNTTTVQSSHVPDDYSRNDSA